MERGNKGSCYEEIGGWMERKVVLFELVQKFKDDDMCEEEVT